MHVPKNGDFCIFIIIIHHLSMVFTFIGRDFIINLSVFMSKKDGFEILSDLNCYILCRPAWRHKISADRAILTE